MSIRYALLLSFRVVSLLIPLLTHPHMTVQIVFQQAVKSTLNNGFDFALGILYTSLASRLEQRLASPFPLSALDLPIAHIWLLSFQVQSEF